MSQLDHGPTNRPSKSLLACGAAALLVLNAGLLAIRPQTGQAGVVVSPERFRIPLGTSRLTTTIEIRNRTSGLIEIISVWPSCDCHCLRCSGRRATIRGRREGWRHDADVGSRFRG